MTSATAERPYSQLGKTSVVQDHDHDLIHFLSNRLDTLWRCDQCIANAEGNAQLQAFWRDIKKQEIANVNRARELIKEHVKENCF